MKQNFPLELIQVQKIQAMEELRECNELTIGYGLQLSENQIKELVEKRFEALLENGRIEFGQGILKKLVTEFCDSPYIFQETYEDTLLELQDCFYYFKNESMDLISDDELISFMKHHFDGKCQGSLEYLSGTSLEELCRNTRYGYETDDTDIYGHSF
ncbi:DUF6323 family protein [Aminipila terrae]|uniref:Uncharacterized protein n=1 Tax=Aminipila terrae TaxID=2697030 RepID=A0A6P1MHN4_9FIRM|nr:DUF6323 family protein [Aminipila terrae]QHI73572.1 hypothetical protein Ami3637_15375 [Aminipila terrae]